MKHTSAFDIDLKFGEIAEGQVRKLLIKGVADKRKNGVKIEVKHDRRAWETGNLYIEFISRGKPSGIQITKAEWWVFVLDRINVMLWFRTRYLKSKIKILIETKKCRTVPGGDSNTSWGYVIKISDLLEGK